MISVDARTMTSKYLGALNDGLEAMETPDGLVIWVPAYYSDNDGVVLSVRASAGGWVITDDGSTMSHLRTAGAATDSPSFLAAWDRIARPAGAFVPGDPGTEDGEITAWATDENIGDVLNLVALAAVRAEGLAFIREHEGGERFTTKILRQITDLMSSSAVAARGLVRGNTVGPRSGRRKRVTTSIESEGRTLAVFQTLSGRDESSRERSFEHAFTLLSQAQIGPESRYAVLDRPEEWEPVVLHEMREASTLLPYGSDFDERLAGIVDRLPATV